MRIPSRSPLLAGRAVVAAVLAAAVPVALAHGQGELPPRLPEPPEPTFAELAVPPGWLADRQGDAGVVAVDVRPVAAYAAGHLPSARHLELAAGCAAAGPPCVGPELGAAGLAGEETLVLYGDGASGAELGRLFWLLEWSGAHEVKILDGGVDGWIAAGGRLEAGPAPPRRRSWSARPRAEAVAGLDWLRERVGLPGTEVLDLRDEGLWTEHGYQPPPRWATGHVPNALPYDFRSWLPVDGRWPAPGPAWRTLRKLGPRVWTTVDLEADFVLYGEGPEDAEPGLGYLLLRWMGIRARVLPGAFRAWAEAPEAPIVRILSAGELAALLTADGPDLTADLPRPAVALLDLREDWDFDRGHLPGAVNLPISRFAAEYESVVARRWPRARADRLPFVLYCYGPDCVRSRDGLAMAAQAGFTNLCWFRGGVDAWNQAGFPLIEPLDLGHPSGNGPEPPDGGSGSEGGRFSPPEPGSPRALAVRAPGRRCRRCGTSDRRP